jgi:hypothetical protein
MTAKIAIKIDPTNPIDPTQNRSRLFNRKQLNDYELGSFD